MHKLQVIPLNMLSPSSEGAEGYQKVTNNRFGKIYADFPASDTDFFSMLYENMLTHRLPAN
jgi:hypothetical protein